MGSRFKDKKEYLINVLSDTLQILEQFLHDTPELGISELSEKTGLHKNKVFRILATLEYYGYIEQNPETQQYRLGIKVLQLGQSYLRKSGLAVISDQLLTQLNEETGETVVLAVFSDNDVVCISVKESPHKLKVSAAPGERYPLHANAVGKIKLYASYEQHGALPKLQELKKFTEKTITNQSQLLDNIKEIDEIKYAIDDEEWQEGIVTVAAPVRDYTTRTVAAIGLFVPIIRLNEERKQKLIKAVIKTANELSFKIGFPYFPPI